MAEPTAETRESPLTAVWRRIPRWQAYLLVGAAVLVLGTLAVWGNFFSGRHDFVPLYQKLDARDMAAITTRLEKESIPYEINTDGTEVRVPAGDVARARLVMAQEGLPKGGVVGLEIVGQGGIGTTDFERRVNYLRGLQGELTRTIKEIEGVEDARVHIVLPKESVFVSQSRPASAAVFVKLKPYAELKPDQVLGVINLVSHAVEGLEPENVTVIDVSGRILSAAGGLSQSGEAGTWSDLEVKHAFEKNLQEDIQSLLEQVLGPGNVVTKVTAQLNFDRRVIDRNLFEPAADGAGILISMQELREEFQGTGVGLPVGPPGDGEIFTYQAAGETGESSYSRTETTRNYEVNVITEHMVVAPGKVERLSVAVVVNAELTEEKRQAIERVVASAIGYDPERRDQITVTGIPFDTSMAEEVLAQMKRDQQEQEKAREEGLTAETLTLAAVAGVFLILLLVFLVFLIVRGRRQRGRQEQVIMEEMRRAVQAAARAEEDTLKDSKENQLRRRIKQLVQEHPENVAQLLRTWLAEE